MKALLNNEVIELNELAESQIVKVDVAQRVQFNGKWYFNPDGAKIIATIPEKPSPWHIWQSGQWTQDESRREELLKLAGNKIDALTAELLNAGFEFDGQQFPLTGTLYSQNMAAASAYVIRGQTAGRNLYTVDGGFHLVTDIAGLVAAGDDLATGICMDAVAQKNALSGKTTAELIQFINTNQ